MAALPAAPPSLIASIVGTVAYGTISVLPARAKDVANPIVMAIVSGIAVFISAVAVGVCTGWPVLDLSATVIGALAALIFVSYSSVQASLLWLALTAVSLFMDATRSGTEVERVQSAALVVAPLFAGAVSFAIACSLPVVGKSSLLRAGFVGQSVGASLLWSPLPALNAQPVAIAVGVVVTAVLFLFGQSSSAYPGMRVTDHIVSEVSLLGVGLAALLSSGAHGSSFGPFIVAIAVALVANILLGQMRKRASVFRSSSGVEGSGLALTVCLFGLAVALTYFSQPVDTGLGRSLLLFAVGYTACMCVLCLQTVLLEPLQLYASAAARASTLDYTAVSFLLTTATMVVTRYSTRPAEAAAWIAGQWTALGGPTLPAAVAAHPWLKPLALNTWGPAQCTAVAAVAVFALGALLQDSLSRSTLLFAPLVAEVSARGVPRRSAVALTYTLGHGSSQAVPEVVKELAGAGAKATFFVPASVLQTASGVEAVKTVVKAGHEVGLAGSRANEGAGAIAGAAAKLSAIVLAESSAKPKAAAKNGSLPISDPAAAAAAAARGRVFADTTAHMLTPSKGSAEASNTAVVWYRPAEDSRDIGLVRAANAAGLSVALWSAAVDQAGDVEGVLAAQLAQEGQDITNLGRDKTAGAVVAMSGPAVSAAATKSVLSCLAGRGVGKGAVLSMTGLCPEGGRINEVLRLGN